MSVFILTSTSALFAQEGKSNRGVFLYLNIPNVGFFSANATDDVLDFTNRGVFTGLSVGIGLRLVPIFEISGGLLFNYQIAFNTGGGLKEGISGGWDLGLQTKAALWPEVGISPYLKFEIGYDNTEQATASTFLLGSETVQLNGLRYTLEVSQWVETIHGFTWKEAYSQKLVSQRRPPILIFKKI